MVDLRLGDRDREEPRRRWQALAAPGLLVLLLGVQFWYGLQTGFGTWPKGPLAVLAAPGSLLGWGGVVVLAFLLAWLLAGWWGQGISGLTLRILGCLALGIAAAGLAGLATGSDGGGIVGHGLASLLAGPPLGTGVAVVLLVLMAAASFLLAAAPFLLFRHTPPPDAQRVRMDPLEGLQPRPGLFEGSAGRVRSPYPERRYDEEGNEIPMDFGTRDVGSIRLAQEPQEEEEEEAREEPAAAVQDGAEREQEQEPEPEPTERGLPPGVRYVDEPAPPERGRPEPVEPSPPEIPLPPGVRYVDEETGAPAAGGPGEPVPAPEPPPPPAEASEAAAPAAPPRAAEVPRRPPSARESVSRAMEALRDEDAGARYRAKLEGTGIFEPPRPDAARKKKAGGRKASAAKGKAKKRAVKGKAGGGRAKGGAKGRRSSRTTSAKGKAAEKPKGSQRKGTASASKKRSSAPRRRRRAEEGPEPDTRTRTGAAPSTDDDLFARAVQTALERGAASSVLLSRRLEIGYSRARALMDRLVREGVLGEMTPSGARPVRITREEWEERARGS